jgi:zinc transporter ZupT
MVDANPYVPAPDVSVNEAPSQNASSEPSRVSPWRYVIVMFAIITFLYLGYGFITAMIAREWQTAAISVGLSLASIPFAVSEMQLRDCLAASLAVVTGVAASVVAFIAYFAMFDFDWFSGIFNDKGAGDFGLIMSVAIGFAAGGLLGWFVLSYTPLPSHSRLRDYLRASSGE